MAAGSDVGRDLLDRYRRWPLAGLLAFRGISAVAPVLILIQMYGVARLLPVILVGLVLLTANVAMVGPVWRSRELTDRQVVPWLALDAVLAAGLNLWSAAAVPGRINEPYHDVFWFWTMGTVCLWTAWSGPLWGVVAVAGTVPLQVGMTIVDGWGPAGDNVPMILSRTVWLLAGVVGSTSILLILRLSSGAALAEGVRAGRQAEQIRMLRELHDTALQTLEAIGLTSRSARGDAETRLANVGRAARKQAEDLRAALSETIDFEAEEAPVRPETEIASMVFGLAGDMEAAGVRVRLHTRRFDGVRMSRRRSDALRQATWEALNNVRRHAAARSVTVEGRTLPDRVQVTVTDDGRGFDPDTTYGFGLRQSIVGRVTEAGGGVRVHSSPGSGTSVVMWVPR